MPRGALGDFGGHSGTSGVERGLRSHFVRTSGARGVAGGRGARKDVGHDVGKDALRKSPRKHHESYTNTRGGKDGKDGKDTLALVSLYAFIIIIIYLFVCSIGCD